MRSLFTAKFISMSLHMSHSAECLLTMRARTCSLLTMHIFFHDAPGHFLHWMFFHNGRSYAASLCHALYFFVAPFLPMCELIYHNVYSCMAFLCHGQFFSCCTPWDECFRMCTAVWPFLLKYRFFMFLLDTSWRKCLFTIATVRFFFVMHSFFMALHTLLCAKW